MQTFNFILRCSTKIWHLAFRSYSHFKQSTSIFRGSIVFGQSDMTIVNISAILIIGWTNLCPWTSPNSEFPPLCQVFTASPWVAACLWVFLSSVFVFSNWKVCSIIGLGSGDWLGHWRIFNFFAFKKSWVAFAICLGSLSICEVVSYQFCSIWLNVSREYSLKDLRIHPATSVCSYITNKHQWGRSIAVIHMPMP